MKVILKEINFILMSFQEKKKKCLKNSVSYLIKKKLQIPGKVKLKADMFKVNKKAKSIVVLLTPKHFS